MSYTATALKVMIATPSDVAAERNAIRQALANWNSAHSEARKIVLMPVGWDTHSSPEMGDRPQALINKQVLKGCDILVAVFWTKAGTPTGEHASGTIEEIEEYLKVNQHAMLYFSSAPVVPDSLDQEQYEQLKAFKASCKTRGLYVSYANLEDFANQFYQHLQIKLNSEAFGASTVAPAAIEARSYFVSPPPKRPSIALSEEARKLLKGAAKAEGQIMHMKHLGGSVIGYGNANLTAGSDPQTLARWEAAIREIEINGLATGNTSRSMYRLTSLGYDVADTLPD